MSIIKHVHHVRERNGIVDLSLHCHLSTLALGSSRLFLALGFSGTQPKPQRVRDG
jgi:hypothetical protein